MNNGRYMAYYTENACNRTLSCSSWSVSFDTTESIVNQCFENISALHTFSAKEKDSETGLSYFGARYYSSDLSIWLSVDPMSGKYPSLSPYVYCADNPVKLVDPNGEEYRIPPWLLLKGIARVVEATSKNADVKP